MKQLVLITCLFLSCYSHAQDSTEKYTFGEVGLTVDIPVEFTIHDAEEYRARMKRGTKAMEEANNIKANISETKTLLSANKGQNYFSIVIEPFDPLKDGDHSTVKQVVKNIVTKTFEEKIKGGKADTATTKILIDGIAFDQFRVTVSVDGNKIFNSYLLSTYYKGYDFGISYVYVDERTRLQMETILKSAKFSKQ